ncbi:hypothetical protein [Silicimonas algicola]|uniref:hypothetical protein n=1 Tax=Silicimonas algicola TaxID=1826607 RepID=UPI0011B2053E|nr:hypothetical protein [Silicimonas algicola]
MPMTSRFLITFAKKILVFGSVMTGAAYSMAHADVRATAVAYGCVSLETEFEDGTRSDETYRLHLIQIERLGAEADESSLALYSLGPLMRAAGGGLFVSTSQVISSSANTRRDVLAEATVDGTEYGWFSIGSTRVPTGRENPLYHVRPASEVEGLRSGSAITEFECSQVLFE